MRMEDVQFFYLITGGNKKNKQITFLNETVNRLHEIHLCFSIPVD